MKYLVFYTVCFVSFLGIKTSNATTYYPCNEDATDATSPQSCYPYRKNASCAGYTKSECEEIAKELKG